jgi:fructuronate reductase
VSERLSIAQWDRIPVAARPPIDPRDLGVGIVHLGLGAFHRAHQAVYTQIAMSVAAETEWAICGVSQRTRRVLDDLEPQDGLYTVLERGPSTACRVLVPLRRLLFAREEQAALLEAIAATATRIITLTVTEKAYRHDPATGRLKASDKQIQLDVAGRPPLTVVGQLVRGLQQRHRDHGAPLTVVCCDNLTNNGATLRSLVTDFCAMLPKSEGRALAEWIADTIAFPSTMVDRIVPATTTTDLLEVRELLDLSDQGAVVAEPFSQWVIEDNFAAARPAWERAGAIFTSDVAPYEAMKLRLLNGPHSALAYLGALAGYEYLAEFMAVDGAAAYALGLMRAEAVPTVSVPADFDIESYEQQLLQRFANPGLRHRTSQIAMDGSQKLPQRLLGTISDRVAAGAEPRLSVLGVAAWMRYMSARCDDAGRPLVIEDPLAERCAGALAGASSPATIVDRLLSIEEIFGDLRDDDVLRRLFTEALDRLTQAGALLSLREVVGQPTS